MDNQLKKMAKFNKKHQKGWGWFVHPESTNIKIDAGNVEYNNAIFNSSMMGATADGGIGSVAVAESVQEDDMEDLKLATPYMLRNDEKLIECSPMHPYIKFIFENNEEALSKLATDRFFALKWFYENTKEKDIKNNIAIIVKYLLDKDLIDKSETSIFDIKDSIYNCSDEEIGDFLNILNADTNQEFLRVRTSSLLFGGTDNSIYFRISSIRFNWFDLIWNLIYKYRKNITNITICKDPNTFGGRFTSYIIGNKEIYNISTDEFINLPSNPIVESYQKIKNIDAIENSNKKLKIGTIISESYNYLHPRYAYGFYQKQVKDYLKEDINNILQEGVGDNLTPKTPRQFIETKIFIKKWKELGLNDENLRKLQNYIQTQPPEANLGKGLFKFRFSPSNLNKGQSRSNRIIYLDIITSETNILLYVFAKNEQSDLTSEQKIILKTQADELRKEYDR